MTEFDEQELIEFTQRLVRIRSVNEPGFREQPAAELVIELAERWGWDYEVQQVAPERPNVIITIGGGEPGPTLLFEGHTDVVTEGDVAHWSHDPYGGDIVDGRLYGRGAADMKSGVACMLYAARAVEQAGPFPGTIKLAVLCDEEEMMIGVHHFVQSGGTAGVDAAIVCEPEGFEVCASQKGAVRLRIDLVGAMAHGAMPHQGRNPITAAALFVAGARDVEAALQRELGEHQHLGHAYITPTHLAAGSLPQINVLPGAALLTFDIRTIPGVDHDELLSRLEAVGDRVASELGVEFRYTVLVDRAPTDTPIDHPVVRAVADAHEAITGEPAVYGGVPGTTDGTILFRDGGLPVVVYGPGGKWIAHQADEYVEVSELAHYTNVYADAATRFLHST